MNIHEYVSTPTVMIKFMKINNIVKFEQMKKFISILSILCLLFLLNSCKSRGKKQVDAVVDVQLATGDNSRTSVDWDGIYFGVVPCADCPGIETRITLNKDETYHISWKYRDRGDEVFQNSGTFQWDAGGGIITLGGLDKALYPNQYRVGENRLFQLDKEGNRITGDLAANYILGKVEQ